jgi:ribonuclease HII
MKEKMTANNEYEQDIIKNGYDFIAGVDETGMGSLIADVYVGAVIFPKDIDYKKLLPGLNDSKQKTEAQRDDLYILIKKYAISWSVATASVEEINNLNIYWARFLAARRALESLSIKPDYILMDGNKIIPDISVSQKAIIKGDQKSISIAAASILAKVDRDNYIKELAKKVSSDFDWASNKGYYCKKHIDALKKYGKTEWHRNKFIENFI